VTHRQRAALYLGRELLRQYREYQTTPDIRLRAEHHWKTRQLYALYWEMIRVFWARDARFDPFWRGGNRSCDL
jgi:hypothetical protein